MQTTLPGCHLPLPRANFSSTEQDGRTRGIGRNHPLSSQALGTLLDLGLEHAFIAERLDFTTKVRWRGRHAFTLLLDGRMSLGVDNQQFSLSPGQIAYYPAGSYVAQSCPGQSLFLYLNFNDTPFWRPMIQRGPYVKDYESADLMYLLMARIADAYKERSKMALLLARREGALLADLVKTEVALAAPSNRKYANNLEALVLQVQQNPRAEWTTEMMAKTIHVSVRTLNRIFRIHYGTTPVELVVRERMIHAYHMIAETDATVESAADELGYSSVSSFSRLFKKHIGKSPGQCRMDGVENL